MKYNEIIKSIDDKKYNNIYFLSGTESYYIDKISDWKDILEDIFNISIYKMKVVSEELKDFLLGSEMYKLLLSIEKGLISFLKKTNTKKSRKIFSSLDSLRGLAAISVAVYHFSSDWADF